MSLDIPNIAALLEADYTILKSSDTYPGKDIFLKKLSIILDNGFQQATPIMTNIDITPPAGTLNITASDPGTMASSIAKACADYWATTITPTGIPVGSSFVITSVVNTAATIEPIIEAGLLAIGGSTEPVIPSYTDFVTVIYNAVMTIVWTVTETHTATGATVPYVVTVA